ncbi:MAG: sigma 54-interacting transcriptional regulator [Sandaracinaceae bacterium]|nr:sigma 54-interacting transcriptional regulator [Sandaracinaceae bacterium]
MSRTYDSTLGDSVPTQRATTRWTARVVAIAGRAADEEPRELRAGITPIGRAVGAAGIALDDPRVSRQHASIEVGRDGASVTLDGGASLRLDGQAVSSGPIGDGSVLLLGASAIVFRHRPPEPPSPEAWGILGHSPSVRLLRRTIAMIARTGSTILVTGESGTGKELVASAIHEASGRKGPLVASNTSAIPAQLAEAHLFGHVAGAYTGATTSGPGLFRSADGGTLFLDEIGELAPELQPKLLRVLEDRVVVPVGSTKGVRVDVRVVCATNRDLLAEVDAGRFRGDLYARISDFTLELAPLRDRREDVLRLLARDLGPDAPPLTHDLLASLLERAWRFNVRELRKVATQLKVRGEGAERLTHDMLDAPTPAASLAAIGGPRPARAVAAPAASDDDDKARAIPTEEALIAMLERHRGVVEFVARETGRSRRQVHRWIEKYGLDLAKFRA